MISIIINDGRDANAAGRQTARLSSFLNTPPIFIGVANDLEAAGNLVDALDAVQGRPAIILVNVAPRHGRAKKWGNGSPFSYFWYKKTLVVATIDGVTLSLAKKLHLTDDLSILNVPHVLEILAKRKFLSKGRAHLIEASQFRSYEFLPRVAAYLFTKGDLSGEKLLVENIEDAPAAVWMIDNFGNCKTTLFPQDVAFTPRSFIKTKIGKLECFSQLKDVPDGKAGLVVGSSGLGKRRFVEIVVQGRSAAERFKLFSGYCIF